MRPDRASVLGTAPLSDLLVVLLRQYKRLLAERGLELTEANIRDLAQRRVEQASLNATETRIRDLLGDMIAESLAVLARWNLSYAQALATDMNAIPGWESTSEFLEIANEKSNAELRIASAAALAVTLRAYQYAPYLLQTFAHDPSEMEGVIARRVLLLVSGVDDNAADWFDQVQAWLAQQAG